MIIERKLLFSFKGCFCNDINIFLLLGWFALLLSSCLAISNTALSGVDEGTGMVGQQWLGGDLILWGFIAPVLEAILGSLTWRLVDSCFALTSALQPWPFHVG